MPALHLPAIPSSSPNEPASGDQGLPVLKHASFGHGVNITLGLPILRTSVDHGTALDLAAHAKAARGADPGSLLAAVGLAIELSHREKT